MNRTDRIYFAVHLALMLLVCIRQGHVPHWPWYGAWNLCAIAGILFLAHKRSDGEMWEFSHDWLPAIFFITVFEEVSFLSLAIRGGWQNHYILAFEALLFRTSPMAWMHSHAQNWVIEFLELGYFAFYPLYPVVGGLLWAWRRRPPFISGFRKLTDSLSVGYVICYSVYLLFPTRSPANAAGVQQIGSTHGGVFERLVRMIQDHAGVHGNAFPSAHIMLAVVVVMFAYRYLPRAAPWLLVPVLLMCVGAAYDGYHYSSDVIAGAVIGIVLGRMFAWSTAKPEGRGSVNTESAPAAHLEGE
jgi:membrane-associated phospholipid phosphatase